MHLRLSHLPLLALAYSSEAVAAPDCKCVPSDPCWPSDSAWDALNTTVSGRLIRTTLPASVCYESSGNYDRAACDSLISQWKKPSFHSGNPVSIQDPSAGNNSCLPVYANGTSIAGDPAAGSRGCIIGDYPPYVVNATDASHVQAAIRFATEHNLRLNVKNTGHSSRRAIAAGSLSIWTHHMKTFEFHDHYVPVGCGPNSTDAHMAATVGAGTQDAEVFTNAGRHNVIMVGGTNKDVGVVGWAMGGGHGYMTSTYGMGADNIIEANLVTLEGHLITANECQNPDIYWAIRGGGGNFGVILNVTMKAYPMPPTALGSIKITAKNTTSTREWWKTIAKIHGFLPGLREKGFQGYYTISPPSASTEPFTFDLTLFNYQLSNATVQASWAQFVSSLDAFANTTTLSANLFNFPTFIQLYNSLPNVSDSTGTGGGSQTSRLIPAAALQDADFLAATLESIGPKPDPSKGPISDNRIVGNMIASSVPVANSLNPAWRDAVLHLIVANSWDAALPAADARAAAHDMTHSTGRALRRLAPDSGAYVNEADSNEPNWQWALFGPNYARLRTIKRAHDPAALMWCPTCVGGEDWYEVDEGEHGTRLCRVEWAE
ncbi:FAD-linked oxidoreductase ZEB1 [Lasiodiplodia theobromae]|uniref:FAD-linked oxidoreductase ZEB1 n=1 Tax=Lasiodiplodia theobromae TaxID=45133 RepID=A0A5N5DC28_9PEZI|nr:FAD-linked oxidoreductase ZEB1 [Lasiodiplodia theobromae]